MMGGGQSGRPTLLGNSMGGMTQMGQDSYNVGNNRSQDSGYKTSPCEQYASTGLCQNGVHCWFAHSAQELRTSMGSSTKGVLCKTWLEEGNCRNPSCNFAHGQKELMKYSAVPNDILKVEPCRKMMEKGMCPYGDRCQFSHDIKKRSFQSMAGAENSLDGKFKVVMCDKYPDFCGMGDRCHYAHGYDELFEYRGKQVPNYKRSLCKSWEESGTCQWDKTCMFAHGSHELRSEDNVMAGAPGTQMYFNQNIDFNAKGYAASENKRMKY